MNDKQTTKTVSLQSITHEIQCCSILSAATKKLQCNTIQHQSNTAAVSHNSFHCFQDIAGLGLTSAERSAGPMSLHPLAFGSWIQLAKAAQEICGHECLMITFISKYIETHKTQSFDCVAKTGFTWHKSNKNPAALESGIEEELSPDKFSCKFGGSLWHKQDKILFLKLNWQWKKRRLAWPWTLW